MNITLHKRARTTPAVRREIQQSQLSERKLAAKHGISRDTVSKWKKLETVEDYSHTPHNLNTSLTSSQEAVVIELRTSLLLPIDDLLVVVRKFLYPKMSRSALDRCLRRHGISNLKDLISEKDGPEKLLKKFKDYEPGFIHADIKYLPKMPDEKNRKYLFTAVDRATRWAHLEVRASKNAEEARSFLKNIIENAPFFISKILTDNGKEFTDRFCPTGEREPTGNHLFDQECAEHGIEHRLIKPKKPQTNGMVERFNGRIEDIVQQTRFESAQQLEEALIQYLNIYNSNIPQRNIGHVTPVEAVNKWRKIHPELFKNSEYNHPGLDN
ncbi:IS481 family transposase [Candidatus Electronema sp. JC]|uniref:IS481 family transposase n=1 Tax=Candidatus Electronema sp. JC TaxID=3401570 RepID=UPI003AA96714